MCAASPDVFLEHNWCGKGALRCVKSSKFTVQSEAVLLAIPWSILSPFLQCCTKQWNKPNVEGRRKKREAARLKECGRGGVGGDVEQKRRSGVMPFKLIRRPAGLHPVTLSCSSGPSAIPIQESTSEQTHSSFSSRSLSRYFHPGVFHSSSMAVPFSFSYLSHCHNHSATVGFSKESELNAFLNRKTEIFPLSLPPSFFLPSLVLFLALPSQRAFPSHLQFPLILLHTSTSC